MDRSSNGGTGELSSNAIEVYYICLYANSTGKVMNPSLFPPPAMGK